MTLSPIMKSADPYFNHKVAQSMTDLVMKMDEDEARTFTTLVVGDILEDTIEKNQKTLQRHLNEVVTKRLERVRKAVLATSIKKGADEHTLAFAQALRKFEEVAKDSGHAPRNPYTDLGYKFQESNFRRDPGSGRFQRKIQPHLERPLDDKVQEGMGIPEHTETLTRAQKARFQSEYMQLADFLGAVNESTGQGGYANVMMHIRDNRGNNYVKHQTGTAPDANAWNPKTERLIGVEALPSDLTVGGAAFSLTNSLGASGHTGEKVAHGVNQVDLSANDFAADWFNANNSSAPRNSNERTYDRVRAGSEFIGRVAPYGSQAQVAAKFGQFVGSHGAEAESVFGPVTRRAAYRYRGTERKPDEELISRYDRAVRRENGERDVDPEERKRRDAAVRRAYLAERKKMAEEYNKDKPFGQQRDFNAFTIPDARKKEIANSFKAVRAERPATWVEGRKEVAEYLRYQRPLDPGLFALHLDAGVTPPSEGVLIDRLGQIKAQAIGYGDDHYLPFNLKNLKSLKGGEYIRTRSVGGPTSEDIYTGLVAGARRLEVTSRSGNFSVTFKDDFRGGRRHNDKARRMVRRYQQILDSVQSETVQRQKVQPAVIDAFKRQAQEKYPAWSPRQRAKYVQDQIKDYKENPEMTTEQMDAFNRHITRETEGLPESEARAFRAQEERRWAAEREYNFKLNGEGYAAALKALEEQFPYYIETHYERREDREIEQEKDKGYVEPGRNRPTAASAGWHGAGPNKTGAGGKFSASHADYQRGLYGSEKGNAGTSGFHIQDAARRSRAGETDPNAPATPADGAPGAPGAPRPGANQPQTPAVAAANARFAVVANRLLGEFAANGRGLDDGAYLRYPFMKPEQLPQFQARVAVGDPAAIANFQSFIENNSAALLQAGAINNETFTEYTDAAGHIDRKQFDPALAGTTPRKPFMFAGEGPAYEEGADAGLVQQEAERISQVTQPVTTTKSLGEMNDNELKTEINQVNYIGMMADSLAGIENEAEYDTQLSTRGIQTQVPSVQKLINRETGKQARVEHLENVHKMRALLLAGPQTPGGNGGQGVISHVPETVTNVVHPHAALTRGTEPEVVDNRATLRQRAQVFDQAARHLARTSRPTQASNFEIMAANLRDDANRPHLTQDTFDVAVGNTDPHWPRAQQWAAEQDEFDRRNRGN